MKYALFIVALFMATPIFISCKKEKNNRPPNILFILTDDQGYGDLRFHGNDSIFTPHLDQLAEQSTRFDRFYVSPVCAPTRASLLTGRYHLRTGTSWVTHRKEVMRSNETTLAEILKSNGYQTGCFGKWHNGSQFPNDPNGQGFDEFFGFASGHWNNYFDTELFHNGKPVKTKGYISDVLTDEAIKFIDKNRSKPFFCYIPYNAPHGPFQVPDKYFDKYKKMGLTDKNACVYGMVENVDDNIGRLIFTLDSLNISDETIVVFMTDNGPNGQRFNDGMRGTKAHVHEGGVRVPCFFKWPKKIKENRGIETIASHIDFLPTMAELCEIDLPDSLKLDGRSLVPLMRNEKNGSWPARIIYSIQNDGEDRMTRGSARTDQYRFVLDDKGEKHLYDMIGDPSEKNNLSANMPELADSIFNQYKSWYQDVTADLSVEPVPVGYVENPTVELLAPDAKIAGGISFKGGMGWSNDYIINWKNGGEMNWDIDVRTEGEYIVKMYCNYKELGGAEFLFGEDAHTFKLNPEKDFYPPFYPSPDRLNRGGVYEKDWNEMQIGKVKLQKGRQFFSIKMPTSIEGVFELKKLELVRQS